MRALGLLLLFLPGLALAHEGHAHVDAAESMWTWNPLVLVPLGLSATLYTIGTARLWRYAGIGRGVRPWQALCFAGGWLFLFGALVAPLHWLGERLFAAHMVEHELLMMVAAPLIAVARPGGAMLWGLPAGWRAAMGGAMQGRAFTAVWRSLTRPAVATVIHGAALWAWHIPAFYNAALKNDVAHWLQHVCFLASALLFWWALLRGEDRERGYGGAVFYLFLTAAHSSFLGVLITLARREIYPLQSGAASAWGLSALQDQQLAGLIMWVLAGMVYVMAALILAGIWIAGASSRSTNHASLR